MKCYCACGWPILLAYRPSGETQTTIFFDRSQRSIGQSITRCPHCGLALDANTVQCLPPSLRVEPKNATSNTSPNLSTPPPSGTALA